MQSVGLTAAGKRVTRDSAEESNCIGGCVGLPGLRTLRIKVLPLGALWMLVKLKI